MSDGELLLREIAASPRELTPKLAFLDWAGDDPGTVRGWLSAAADILPHLTADGVSSVGYWATTWPETVRTDYVERLAGQYRRYRAMLLEEVEMFAACLAWLAGVRTRKTVYGGESSYGYKHRVEESLGVYVTNGSFIAAAVHSEIPTATVAGSLNTLHGISRRSLGKI